MTRAPCLQRSDQHNLQSIFLECRLHKIERCFPFFARDAYRGYIDDNWVDSNKNYICKDTSNSLPSCMNMLAGSGLYNALIMTSDAQSFVDKSGRVQNKLYKVDAIIHEHIHICIKM